MELKNQWNQKSSVQEFGINKAAKPIHPKPSPQVPAKVE